MSLPKELLDEFSAFPGFSEGSEAESRRRWDSLAKPLGGLGILEDLVCRISKVRGTPFPKIGSRALCIFCSDNGIVEEGVSQTSSDVTRVVFENMGSGLSSACIMAKAARCDVFPLDVGISPCGTENFLKGDAMSREECVEKILLGIGTAKRLSQKYDILATGEMGIGNTTTSASVLCSLLSLEPGAVVGRGAGLSDAGLSRKTAAVRDGIAIRKPNPLDAIDVISKVGGFDIAAMCGFFIGGALSLRPVVVDGFISAVSALCAARIFPSAREALIPSHASSERAAKIALSELCLEPPIQAGMHLGEGTGCMALLPLLDMAFDVYYKMPTFSQTGIEEYRPL